MLLAIALPAWTMVENPSPLGAYDAVAATLFLGSTAFTEWISRSRHPESEDYRRVTLMLVPWGAAPRRPLTARY
ncbi:MAG: hypothetical protein H5T82_07930 [Demequina sp.]|nr:hypothetical protein [Demequina sp.]